ncbi:hypothetical protein Tco_0418981 [Tanacetum coccineum]
MEDEVDRCSVEKKYFEIEKKQLLINNDRLLEENISCDVLCAYLSSLHRVDKCENCSRLETGLLNQRESNKSLCELQKCFATLEEYSSSVELDFQNYKEQMICHESRTKNTNFFINLINNKSVEITDLQAQLQEESMVVNELKQLLATLKEKSQISQSEASDADLRIQKIEYENVSLTFQVSSLIKEREHIKLEYIKLYDSVKQTRAQNNLTTDSLQQRINDHISKNAKLKAQLKAKFSKSRLNQGGTIVEKNDLSKTVTSHLHTNKKIIEKCTKVLALGLLKIELEPINAYFKNNRVVHRDYLRVTKEHVETLHELLEEAGALKSLDERIGHASKFAERIQEFLVYVSASCPFTKSGNEKWAPATSHKRNNKPYVDTPGFSKTSVTNTQKIQRPSSRSQKNKVEAQHRMFKSSSNKNNNLSDYNVNVKNVDVSSNSANVCLSCNECLFYANHDVCIAKYLKDVNKRKKVKSVKQKEKNQWKPIGRVFTSVGLRWNPTGRMFNMEGNIIQSSPATIVPPGNRLYTIRIPAVAPSVDTSMRYLIAKNYLIRAHVNSYVHPFNLPYWAFIKNSEFPDSSSVNVEFLGIIEIVLLYLDSGCSKHMIGQRDKLLNFVSKFIGTVRFGNDHFAAIMGYGDLKFRNVLITCVYYVEGLGHNLFSVGQFCDLDLEVAFRKHACFMRNLNGVDLLSGSRGSNLYTISLKDVMKSSPICLLSKASKTKS